MTADTTIERRAETLDTIAAVLPMHRRGLLAEVLSDRDVETAAASGQ